MLPVLIRCVITPLQLRIGLALELVCFALSLALELLCLALCLSGNLACLALGLSLGLGDDFLYLGSGLLCSKLSANHLRPSEVQVDHKCRTCLSCLMLQENAEHQTCGEECEVLRTALLDALYGSI